jgi:hypothetical protein
MSNDILTEGQLRHKREREKEIIDHQRDLYERAIRRQEWEKEERNRKFSGNTTAEAQAIHQAKVDKATKAQVAAQVAAKETAEGNAKYFADLKQKQATLPPEKERGICPTCGEAVDLGLAFHRRGDPTLYDFCPIDPKRALASGRFTREQLLNLGFTL